jgi:hypothetical protein
MRPSYRSYVCVFGLALAFLAAVLAGVNILVDP